MGMNLAYFTASDDGEALKAERRAGGPLGWPQVTGCRKWGLLGKEPIVTRLGPAFDGFATRGYDPVVNMGTLEELLTGRSFEAIMDDPRSGGSPCDSEGAPEDHGVITLTDSLRDALANADDSRLTGVVGPWSETDELQQPGWDDVSQAEHLKFLRNLRDLARRAKDADQRLYCYFAE